MPRPRGGGFGEEGDGLLVGVGVEEIEDVFLIVGGEFAEFDFARGEGRIGLRRRIVWNGGGMFRNIPVGSGVVPLNSRVVPGLFRWRSSRKRLIFLGVPIFGVKWGVLNFRLGGGFVEAFEEGG